MSKFIIFSDSHFHDWQEFAKPHPTRVNTRLAEQLGVMEEVFKLAQEEGASIIFAGDLFHKRQSVDTRVYNLVYELFQKYSGTPLYAIPGNHDKVANSINSESSIDIFNHIPGVEVITKPSKITVTDGDEDIELVMIPYGDETEEIKEYLSEISNELSTTDNTTILVGHLGVDGSLTGRTGHRLEGAFGYQDLKPEVFDFIALGHYHRAQNLGGEFNHFYIGSLTQQTFNEEGYETGVRLIDTKEKTTKHIDIPSTKFLTIEGNNIPDDFEELAENNFIRFQGDKKQTKAITNVVEDLSHIRLEVTEEREIETRIDIDKSTDPKEITKKYMQEYYPEAVTEALECLDVAINVEV